MSNPVLLNEPEVAHAVTLVLAHGAGAPMDSPFMEELAGQLASHGLRVLRFEFPYMAARRADGRKRPPNPMAVLQASLRELCSTIDAPFFLAGKSMGGRVASMMAAELEAQGMLPSFVGSMPEPSSSYQTPRVAGITAADMVPQRRPLTNSGTYRTKTTMCVPGSTKVPILMCVHEAMIRRSLSLLTAKRL